MLNTDMSATVVFRHFGCTHKTIERIQRRFRVSGNVDDCPPSGRPCVTTAADDCYIVLQHLRNWRLTAAATRRHNSIYPYCQKSFETKRSNLFMCTNFTLVKFLPDVIERQGGIGAAVTCTSYMLIGI